MENGISIDIGVDKLLKIIVDWIKEAVNRGSNDRKLALDKFYAPMYQELLRIHAGYASMFTTLNESMPVCRFEDHWIIPHYKIKAGSDSNYYSRTEAMKRTDELKKDFENARKDPDWQRSQFRNKARGLLNSVEGQEERRFFIAVIMYFAEDRAPTSDLHVYLDNLIWATREGGIKEGIDTVDLVFDSPSFRLSQAIANAATPEAVAEAAKDAWCNLALRIAVVTQMYVELEYDILL